MFIISVMVAVVLSAQEGVSQKQSTIPSDYLVLRPVSDRPVAGGASTVDSSGQRLYYDPKAVLADLRDIAAESARIQGIPGPAETFIVWIAITGPAQEAFEKWTEENVGSRLGVFIDGKLQAAPAITSPLSGKKVPLMGFSKAQAESLRETIRAAGASPPS